MMHHQAVAGSGDHSLAVPLFELQSPRPGFGEHLRRHRRDRTGRIENAVILLFAAAATVFAVYTEAFEQLFEFARAHEEYELDELFSVLIIMSVALIALSARRAARLRSEIARRERAEQHATALARHDPLTGLPNRRVLAEHLTAARENVARRGHSLAVLLIDLDRFKPVNDVYGHGAGDMVLSEVAARLETLTPPSGETMLARLGGDEFACVQEHAPGSEAPIRLAKQILNLLRQPVTIGAGSVQIGASIGIALCTDGTTSAEELLRAADIAMYRAKREGRSTFRSFEPAMDAELQTRAALEADLRGAIGSEQIVPSTSRSPGCRTGSWSASRCWPGGSTRSAG